MKRGARISEGSERGVVHRCITLDEMAVPNSDDEFSLQRMRVSERALARSQLDGVTISTPSTSSSDSVLEQLSWMVQASSTQMKTPASGYVRLSKKVKVESPKNMPFSVISPPTVSVEITCSVRRGGKRRQRGKNYRRRGTPRQEMPNLKDPSLRNTGVWPGGKLRGCGWLTGY